MLYNWLCPRCKQLEAERDALVGWLDWLYKIVNNQAEDEGLWFIAQTAPEDYLQIALRKLHAAIEATRKEIESSSL